MFSTPHVRNHRLVIIIITKIDKLEVDLGVYFIDFHGEGTT